VEMAGLHAVAEQAQADPTPYTLNPEP